MDQIVLKAKHFVNAKFSNVRDCPVARAAKETFPDAEYVEEAVHFMKVYKQRSHVKIYTHPRFGSLNFEEDSIKAQGVDPETIIRIIPITPTLNIIPKAPIEHSILN